MAMPRNYKQLAIHNSPCNEVYYKFQDCEFENPFKRFLGECTSFSKDLEQCIRENRENMRERNRKSALERQEKIKSALST